jgi:hypothetical protein
VGVSLHSFQDILCSVRKPELMSLSIGKMENATSVDPLVVAKHETDARYCMYAGPYNQIAYVLHVWCILCHELPLLKGHFMMNHPMLASNTNTYRLAISLHLLHVFIQSPQHIV